MRYFVVLLFSLAAFGQQATPLVSTSNFEPLKLHPHWAISSAASLGASMIDGATTSYALDYRHIPGLYETNPIIVRINQGNNKVFGPGGYAFKLGVWGIQAGLQYVVLRKYDRTDPARAKKMAKIFVVENWLVAAMYDGIAVHNARAEKIIK